MGADFVVNQPLNYLATGSRVTIPNPERRSSPTIQNTVITETCL